MRKRGVITVSDAVFIARGDTLVIGGGDEAEAARVVAVHGNQVTIGPYRWWHRLAAWLRKRRYDARDVIHEALCGLRGHRLTVESRDTVYGDLTLYCWCGARYRDEPG